MFFGSGKLYGGTAKSRKTSTYAIPIVALIQSFMRLNARLKAFIYNGASKTLICEQLSPINYDLQILFIVLYCILGRWHIWI